MSTLASPLAWLLDSSMGPPGPDGNWSVWLRVAFHAANLVICLGFAYATAVIVRYCLKGAGVSTRRMALQTAWLPAMSLKALARVLEVGGPRYHLTTLLDLNTAVWVLVGIAALPGTIRRIRAYRQKSHENANRAHEANLLLQEAKLNAEEKARSLMRKLEELRAAAWTGTKSEELARIEALMREHRS